MLYVGWDRIEMVIIGRRTYGVGSLRARCRGPCHSLTHPLITETPFDFKTDLETLDQSDDET